MIMMVVEYDHDQHIDDMMVVEYDHDQHIDDGG